MHNNYLEIWALEWKTFDLQLFIVLVPVTHMLIHSRCPVSLVCRYGGLSVGFTNPQAQQEDTILFIIQDLAMYT